MTKAADKRSAVAVWDREDNIKEAENQIGDTNTYEEVPNDAKALMKIILNTMENISKRGDVCTDTLNYFIIRDTMFARLYLLSKIQERLYFVPGRLVISNCGLYTEDFSSFLNSHLQTIAKKVKSYINDTNDSLKSSVVSEINAKIFCYIRWM